MCRCPEIRVESRPGEPRARSMDQQALSALPHGAEFRCVDRLIRLEPGQSGDAEWTPRADAEWCAGHFPGQPLVPGVLMIEALAQLAGVVAQADPNIPPLAEVRLTAVRAAKILGTVPPGQAPFLTVQIQGRLGPLIQAQGSVSAGPQTLASAQITLSGRET
jgi:3-hydroxyacyl-[acyl-carrier-protein] dehydratase